MKGAAYPRPKRMPLACWFGWHAWRTYGWRRGEMVRRCIRCGAIQ